MLTRTTYHNRILFYLAAAACPALALVLRQLLESKIGELPHFLLLYPTVFLAAMLGDGVAGLLSTAVAALLTAYLWMAPQYDIRVQRRSDLIALVIFCISGIGVSVAAEAYHRNRKRLENLLRERAVQQERSQFEQEFHTLANSMPQLCWMANADGWITWYNERWYAYTGTTPEQMRGWGWKSVHHPETLPNVMERWTASIETGEPFEMVFPMKASDGSFSTFLTRIVPLRDAEGTVVRWFGTNTDITELRGTQKALLESEKLASVGRMSAAMAHELNNPLEAVTNLLYLMNSVDGMPELARTYLDTADSELRQMTHIVRQSLGFYRELTAPALASVNAVLDSTIGLLKSKIKAKHAVIVKDWDGDVQISCIPGELRQVFSNLLVNSLDAIGEKGTVTLKVTSNSSSARITVADNGKGMTVSSRRQIFEPFFTTKGSTGTGLGLWVCKQIIDKHGGTIQVRSKLRHGSVFSVVLQLPPESVRLAS